MSQQPRSFRWWYYIPHEWNGETAAWEDVYLLPDLQDSGHTSLWLTVDAAGAFAKDDRERAEVEAKLAGATYFLERETLDMLVRADRFTKAELLDWACVALGELGLPCDELIEGSLELFSDSNDHARAISEAKRRLDDYIGEGSLGDDA